MQRQNKKIFVITFLAFVLSCSRQEENHSLGVLVWQQKIDEKIKSIKTSRDIAEEEEVECRGDYFSVKHLKNEIKILETKLEGQKKLSGEWRHLNFESLPVAQAEFLKRYQSQLGDYNRNDYDFSYCLDVPCILNAIYGKQDSIEGYAIYYWYLKMGNLLAVDNKVPQQISSKAGEYNGKIYPFESYLFDKNELYAFWRLSHQLSSRFSTLRNLIEIQRVPRKSAIEKRGSSVCGVAISNGYILLNDGCLDLGLTKDVRDLGEFYPSVIHEMSHQIDYLLGSRELGYYSSEKEWLQEGEWFLKESVDPDSGTTKRQWDSTLPNNKWASNYAQTSPAEHFAETLAYYRYEPDRMLKTIPETTYPLVKEKFYDGNSYDLESLIRNYSTELDIFEKDIFETTNTCLSTPYQVELSQEEFQKIDLFSQGLDEARARCLARNGFDFIKKIIRSIKINQIDGCKLFVDGNRNKILNAIETETSKKISHHVKNAIEDEKYFENLKSFYSKLNDSRYSTEAFVNCYGELNQQACYEKNILEKVRSLIPANVRFSETYQRDLARQFLLANSFESAKELSIKMYNNFLFSSEDKIRETANGQFDVCESLPPSDQAGPKLKDFSPGEIYVISSLISCLNEGIPRSLNFILENLNSDILIRNPKEKLLLTDLIKPIFISNLKQILIEKESKEKKLISEYKIEKKDLLVSTLKSDFSWLTSFNDNKKQRNDCLLASSKQIEIVLLYHLKKDEFLSFFETICNDVLLSAELKKFVDDNYLKSIDAALDEILKNLNDSGRNRASACLSFYPRGVVGDFLYQKKRIQCLEEQWKFLENRAIRKFQTEGLGSKFKYDEVELMVQFKSESLKLKDKIIQEDLK
jgi:hypothetical protein